MKSARIKLRQFVSAKSDTDFLRYWHSEPGTDGKKPLIVYIHGAGSRGTDPSVLQGNSALQAILRNAGQRAVIVAPQCSADTWFDQYALLTEFIERCLSEEEIDRGKVYLIGSSMGGYTVWQLAMSHPQWFTAVVPICGGGMYWNAARLKDLKIWAFHGALDETVLPEESSKMVKAVNAAGGNASITILPHDAHNAWDTALGMSELWEWLFDKENERGGA